MYASKKSVAKAQGSKGVSSTKLNELKHRGMQKDHIQVTPDGKVIQHYRMDSRSASMMKAFKKAQKEAAEKEEVTEENPETEVTE